MVLGFIYLNFIATARYSKVGWDGIERWSDGNGNVAVSYRNGLGGIERRCGMVVREGEGLDSFSDWSNLVAVVL